ncbi:palmitoyltransferase ZDHHC18-A [Denticeps clupeoides]|uniref:GPI mannosyltransferase 2 n=1 Tax=Denticeps clupeoides TaxID=299321 RepID=A0AAY4ABN3_9TELE|nr:GPI mannosyltransferase 2 [Denticeps clupeoides]
MRSLFACSDGDGNGMDEARVVGFAAATRLLSLILQAVLNAVIPDHGADAFSPPRAEEPLLLDPAVDLLLGGLGRWDAEHFLFIAERGYVFEHNFAFFPLFPLALRSFAAVVLWPASGWLSLRGRLLVAASVLNSGFFVVGALLLYRLGRLVLQERRLAFSSALLYCVSPAHVFMMAGYSESLFCSLTFGGLLLLEMGFTCRACLLFGLATGARANGLVNAGFLLYLALQRALQKSRALSIVGKQARVLQYAWIAARFIFTTTAGACVTFLPFVIFQYYGYQTFCNPSGTVDQVSPPLYKLAVMKKYRLPDENASVPVWCLKPIPLLYSYIQDVYWDVGFLRYFQLKQLPNFLLASPVVILGGIAACTFFTADPGLCLWLGLWQKKREKQPVGFYSPKLFVYVVHAAALLVFGTFCMHVQVLTRFLASSSPVLFWISAHLLLSHEPLLQVDQPESHNRELKSHRDLPGPSWGPFQHNPVSELLNQWWATSILTRCILGYFLSYWLLGLALHCNFLPWT